MYLLKITKMESNHYIKKIIKFIDEVSENKYVYLYPSDTNTSISSSVSSPSKSSLCSKIMSQENPHRPLHQKNLKIKTNVIGQELHAYEFKKQVLEYSKSYKRLNS